MSRYRKVRSAGECVDHDPTLVQIIERLPDDDPLLYGPDGTPLVYVKPPVWFTLPAGASRDDANLNGRGEP